MRPSNITVERLIRHFSANEYEDSCGEKEQELELREKGGNASTEACDPALSNETNHSQDGHLLTTDSDIM